MTDAQWEIFSYEAVVAAGVLYFLAMLAYSVEWAALRRVVAPVQEPVAVGGPAERPAPPVDAEPSRTVALAGRLGFVLTLFAAGIHFVALVGRGLAADPNRVPWGNMYEFTISGTFVVALFFLISAIKLDTQWLGAVVVMFVLVALMAAFLGLDDAVLPLPDALNSPWLVIHVIAAILATGAFTLGGMFSILLLIKERTTTQRGYLARVPSADRLDRLSYQMHAFGFPAWTFGVLISGPIWAHQAWGAYWNWDPKEVWAFITWVLYAAYLHARATAGWKGKGAAWLAIAGLLTLWFNFIGINFFSTTSQHSYAGADTSVVVVGTVQTAQEVGVVIGGDDLRL